MKIIGLVLIACMLWFGTGFCADEIDIPEEVRPSFTKVKGDTIVIHLIDKSATLTLRKGYMEEGEFVANKTLNINFKDAEDNPETPEDETSTRYTDFMATISIDKPALKALIEAEVGG